MIRFAYLGALLVSLAGLALLDRRFRLAFWVDRRRAGACVLLGVTGFLLWDGAGLALGIFARGDSPHMTGLLLAPELPVEEAFFLALLCYNTLLVWRAADRAATGRRSGRRRGAPPGAVVRPDEGARPDNGARPDDGARPEGRMPA